MNERWLKRINLFWVGVWILVFLGAGGVLIWATLSNSRTDAGGDVGTVEIKSLSCESDALAYPLFKVDDSIEKNMRVLMTYDEQKVKSISLQYTLYYGDKEALIASEAANHAAMNMMYGKDGLDADSYSSVYAMFDDKYKFSLFASGDDLDGIAMKYFMLDGLSDYKITRVKEKYDKIGLKCIDK